MRLTLIALCLMTAIAAEAKSGNNGTELPNWILEPEEGLFIGISFPGEGREQLDSGAGGRTFHRHLLPRRGQRAGPGLCRVLHVPG